MRYRVQYWLDNKRHSEEVEARSPDEAVVKFRFTRTDRHDRGGRSCQVLSVSIDPVCDELPW